MSYKMNFEPSLIFFFLPKVPNVPKKPELSDDFPLVGGGVGLTLAIIGII